MLTVGLTGNIASGKSTVASLLRDRHGLAVIDADQVARDVVAPCSPALDAIVRRFGERVLSPDGSLDRATMRAVVLADPRARADLEAITHPAIYRHIDRWLREQRAAGAAIVVVEAALLVETGQQRRYDRLMVVSCAPDTQIRRLMQRRGMSERAARSWLTTQLPASAKEEQADIVLRNDGTMEELERAVAQAVLELPRK